MISAAIVDSERRAVLFLAKRFEEGNTRVEHGELAEVSGLDERGVWQLADRLSTIDVLSWESTNSWIIRGRVCDAAREIVNPAPMDYWRDFEVWLRSRRWSLPLMLLFAGIPLIAMWIILLLVLCGVVDIDIRVRY